MEGFFFNAEPTTDLVAHPTGYDREYDADDHAAFFAPFFSAAGVLGGVDADACRVYVKSGSALGVRAGCAYVKGRMAVLDGSETLEAGGGGIVVLRMDNSPDVRAFRLLCVETPVREGDVYDLELARVATGGGSPVITDSRSFLASAVRPPSSSIPDAPLKNAQPALEDTFGLCDSADGNKLKRMKWSTVRAAVDGQIQSAVLDSWGVGY